MKKILITIIYVAGALLNQAQESITIKGKTIQGQEAQTEYWVFKDAEDTIIAINYSEYEQMVRKLEISILKQNQLDSIIKAKDELLAAYENYEEKADTHIVTQDSLINIADSLYTGYKDLYNKLKSITDMKKFSLVVGMGLNEYDRANTGFVFDAGVEYNKTQFSFQFGNKYNGLTIKHRIPIF